MPKYTHLVVRCFMLVLALCFHGASFAQVNNVEMADTMRSSGKIYIVVAVCLTILIGLFLYVLSLDKKISNMEKEG